MVFDPRVRNWWSSDKKNDAIIASLISHLSHFLAFAYALIFIWTLQRIFQLYQHLRRLWQATNMVDHPMAEFCTGPRHLSVKLCPDCLVSISMVKIRQRKAKKITQLVISLVCVYELLSVDPWTLHRSQVLECISETPGPAKAETGRSLDLPSQSI